MLPLTRSRNRSRFFGIPFSPAKLFAGGTVAGAWYDPSDLSTMFTTSAGTTPVAMPGLGAAVPVGAMLDKRALAHSVYFDGSGDYLSTSVNAGNFGSDPFTVEAWVYLTVNNVGSTHTVASNYLNSTTGWALQTSAGKMAFNASGDGADIIGTTVLSTNTWYHIAVSGAAGSIKLFINGTQEGSTYTGAVNLNGTSLLSVGALIFSSNPFNTTTGYISNLRVVKGTAVYTGNFTPPTAPLSPISGTSLLTCGTTWSGNPAITTVGNTRVDGLNPFTASPVGNHAIASNNTTARPELRARVNLLVATATLSTQNVTTQATSYTLRFAGAGSITLSGTATGSYSAGTHTITCTAGTLTLTVSGTVTTADLRPANSGALLPAYQAVVDANTYDTSGFPLYLRFDGIDDSMYTPANLNLSGTDKVAVFAGVRKLSDAAQGVVAELSATIASNNGTFLLAAPDGATQTYGWDSKGTAQVDAVASSFVAPITNVLAGTADIAGDSCIIRVNGAVADTETGDQGTGNFGTYPLFIGARNNASTRLNGQVYGLLVVGSAVSAGNISATEQWVAGKTGIVIP